MSSSLSHDPILAEIRATMARKQRSRAELAAALGMGRGALWRRLSGEVPLSVGELADIAKFLDVPVSTFYEAGSTTAQHPATADAG